MEVILSIPRDPRSKIMSQEEAAQTVKRWKTQARVPVFTNGCFDILHQGHVTYLHQARLLGDAMVVGINSDASVARIKGPKRPILSQQERAELVAALECVDLVVIFEEDNPGSLIARLEPLILVKGADWPKDQVIGRETVEALGGEVKSIPLVEGRSTTGIIDLILSRYGQEG